MPQFFRFVTGKERMREMNILLLTLLSVTEIVFASITVPRKPTVGEWSLGRLLVDGGEVLVFLVMLPAPGIDLGMRFRALFVLLGIRTALSAIRYLLKRKTEKKKKPAGIVFSLVGSVFLFFCAGIPSFLFADYEGLPMTGRCEVKSAHAILVDEDRTESFETDGSKREVPVYFFYPGDSEEGEKYPVVFFSHGAFGYYQSNMSTYLELASHGYVVVSIEHPYHALFTEDTEGKRIIADAGFLQEIRQVNDSEMSEEEIFEISSPWMELRLADSGFVVDTIKEAARDGAPGDCFFVSGENREGVASALSMIDCEEIGFMGHSLGGAAAVTLGRTREDIGAVIDFDGTMLGEIEEVSNGVDVINGESYDTPLLCFDSEAHHKSRVMSAKQGVPYANNVVLEHAADGYSTYIAGTGHMNYTDLPLFSPFLADMLGTGEVDAEACITKMNAVTLHFFDCYLKGSGSFQVEEGYFLQSDGN